MKEETGMQIRDRVVTQIDFKKLPTVEDAKVKVESLHALINGLKDENDIVMYKQQSGDDKPFYKLTLTNKLYVALDFRVVSEDYTRIYEVIDGKPSITYNFRTLIKSPYGFEGVGFGACSSNEKGKSINDEQKLSGMAQTRSRVRALRVAISISECSVEEYDAAEEDRLTNLEIEADAQKTQKQRLKDIFAKAIDFCDKNFGLKDQQFEDFYKLHNVDIDTIEGIRSFCFLIDAILKNQPDKTELKVYEIPENKLKEFHATLNDLEIDYKKEHRATLKQLYFVESVKHLNPDLFAYELDRVKSILKKKQEESNEDLPF